jgi:uncharacterized membrane protein
MELTAEQATMNGSLHPRWQRRAAAAFLGLVLGLFLGLTPRGLLSRADVVGYAVCGRLPSHSFFIAGRQLPVCARCTGTFLGALIGLFGQAVVLRRRRESDFPPTAIFVAVLGFIAIMGIDGVNSFLNELGLSRLYEPQQWLRLATGALNGLALSGLLWPILNFSLWASPSPSPVIQRWRDLGVLLLLEMAMVVLALTRWPVLLYPVALLSAAGVLALLAAVNSALILMVTGWENRYHSYREATVPLLLGLTLAIVQVGLIAIIRYAATGTLDGFPGLS